MSVLSFTFADILVYSPNSGYALFTLRSLYAAVPGKEEKPQCGNKTENTITLCWEPPLNNGGKPITGYVVEIREIGSQIWGKYVTSL